MSTQLAWSHYTELLPIKDINKINYYIKICEVQNLSVRELRGRIKSNEYERLDENIKLKLTNSKEENNIRDFIKHPIVIRTNKNIVSEKLLHQVILENIYIGGTRVQDNYYIEIKNKLINNEVYKKVKDYSKNRNDLNTYYDVGKLLVEAQGGEKRAKYGDNLIKEYSKKLSDELGKGYSTKNLKRMRQFYLLCKKGQAVPTQLTWSHYCELLSMEDINKINYYIKISIDQNLSYRELHIKIKNNEYERLSEETKNKLITTEVYEVEDFIKNPIFIKNSFNYSEISEKILKKLILEDIDNFLKELGNGFTYVESEYKLKMGDRYNYIDLLLFNYIYNCFVVVELKVTELKKDHIGQIQIYMNYIDENIKQINQNKTIGIIICKEDNSYVIRYCSNSNIYSTTYRINLEKVGI